VVTSMKADMNMNTANAVMRMNADMTMSISMNTAVAAGMTMSISMNMAASAGMTMDTAMAASADMITGLQVRGRAS